MASTRSRDRGWNQGLGAVEGLGINPKRSGWPPGLHSDHRRTDLTSLWSGFERGPRSSTACRASSLRSGFPWDGEQSSPSWSAVIPAKAAIGSHALSFVCATVDAEVLLHEWPHSTLSFRRARQRLSEGQALRHAPPRPRLPFPWDREEIRARSKPRR